MSSPDLILLLKQRVRDEQQEQLRTEHLECDITSTISKVNFASLAPSKEALQQQLDHLLTFCQTWAQAVNLDKIMIFLN